MCKNIDFHWNFARRSIHFLCAVRTYGPVRVSLCLVLAIIQILTLHASHCLRTFQLQRLVDEHLDESDQTNSKTKMCKNKPKPHNRCQAINPVIYLLHFLLPPNPFRQAYFVEKCFVSCERVHAAIGLVAKQQNKNKMEFGSHHGRNTHHRIRDSIACSFSTNK